MDPGDRNLMLIALGVFTVTVALVQAWASGTPGSGSPSSCSSPRGLGQRIAYPGLLRRTFA